MEQYQNLSSSSGIVGYHIGEHFIVVRFRDGKWTYYNYTYTSAGQEVIEHMKNLARSGAGLHSYISSRTTNPPYSKKGNSFNEVVS